MGLCEDGGSHFGVERVMNYRFVVIRGLGGFLFP